MIFFLSLYHCFRLLFDDRLNLLFNDRLNLLFDDRLNLFFDDRLNLLFDDRLNLLFDDRLKRRTFLHRGLFPFGEKKHHKLSQCFDRLLKKKL